jgi:integrase
MCSTRSSCALIAATLSQSVWKRDFPGKRERDRLVLALVAYAGLRRSELLGLDWDGVDLGRRLLRVCGTPLRLNSRFG